jgi:glycosyltransferase involved in cell wall biosynthesis
MVGSSLQRDGAPISQYELATGLARKGYSIDVMAPRDGAMRAVYAAAGIPVQVCPELICSAAVPTWYERDVQRLAKVFAETRPDLIFVSTIDMFPAIDAARVVGIPSLWNVRESEPWRVRLADRHIAIAARALACFGYPESVVFVAKSSLAAWSDFIRVGRAHVIYNAIHPSALNTLAAASDDDRRKEGNIQQGEKLIASVGTLCERKGQVDLALAINRLPPPLLSNIRVAFVGAAERQYDEKIRAALTPAAASRCIFPGDVSDAISWIAAAAVLVNTSRSEAFPRTFIEAAAAGTPIIATDVDGASERLNDKRSALLYEPGNIDRLADALVSLLTDIPRGERLVGAAHADLIASWTFDEMTSAYAQLIDHALAGRT